VGRRPEQEILERLQRQKDRIEQLNTKGGRRISMMLKEKSTTIARSSAADDVLSELDTLIARRRNL